MGTDSSRQGAESTKVSNGSADVGSTTGSGGATAGAQPGERPLAEQVTADYAAGTAAIPRDVTDSIAGLRDPQKIMAATEAYVKSRDRLLRSAIAEHYGISVDSVDRILGR